MPKGDVLWKRLEEASDDGRKRVADALGFLARDVESLSAAIRKEAGGFFGNLFRKPHDLPYGKILQKCAYEAGQVALFPSVLETWFDDSPSHDAVEEYIERALAFSERRLREPLTGRQWREEATKAEGVLRGIPESDVVINRIHQILKRHQDPDSPPLDFGSRIQKFQVVRGAGRQ
jgi:hypothetical protein